MGSVNMESGHGSITETKGERFCWRAKHSERSSHLWIGIKCVMVFQQRFDHCGFDLACFIEGGS